MIRVSHTSTDSQMEDKKRVECEDKKGLYLHLGLQSEFFSS